LQNSSALQVRLWLAATVLLAVVGGPASGGIFTPLGTQSLTYALIPPSDCANCHADYDPQNHIEPWNTWAGSMMANAARDPIFWAALDVANHDAAQLGFPGIGEYCLRCHAPAGWLAGRANAAPPPTPGTGAADGCALVGQIDAPGDDFTGLGCHFCHRLKTNTNPPAGQEVAYFENGNFWLDDDVCPDARGMPQGPCRRGPYDYRGLSHSQQPFHEWAYSTYHTDNEVCGNCHNVTNPLLHLRAPDGTDLGVGFPIERTYKEWQQSDFSDTQSADFASCSSCHMPDATANPVYASGQALHNRCSDSGDPACAGSGGLPIHQLAGGNAWSPRVLQGEYPNLDRDSELAATTALALDMLQNRSAAVEITAASSVGQGGTLPVRVKVTNLTGHKLPTGYGEGRRMWLQVVARDHQGQIFWQSGAWDPTTGILADDPAVKVYEVQQGIWDFNGDGHCDVEDAATGGHLFHFVRNNCIALDNRIPPLGFRPRTASDQPDPETLPVNYSYAETSPGSGELVNWDTTSYLIPVPPSDSTRIEIEVTLNYQTASKEYVEFLRDQAIEHDFPDDCLQRTAGPIGMSRGEYLYAVWSDPRYGRSPPVNMGGATVGVKVVDLFADEFESGDVSLWSSSTQ
jgi:hypothetical protein